MSNQDLFIAVKVEIEDGEILGFEIDNEAMVGDIRGPVWDHETGEWSDDWDKSHAVAQKRLGQALRKLNSDMKRQTRRDLS